jgi:hypothetical protein
MADKKISQFTVLSEAGIDAANDVLPIVDATGPETKKASVSAIVGAGALAGVGELNVDNITINGNAITSTDTNGNIDLTPDGTGVVNVPVLSVNGGSNTLTVGNATPVALTGSTTAPLQCVGINNNTCTFMTARFSNNASQPTYFTAKSRGATVGSHVILQDDDNLGGIAMFGSDGTTFVRGAEIFAQVDGSPGLASMPSALIFRVNGTVEKFRIASSGLLTDDKGNLRAIPQSGSAKTGSYTLAVGDVGQFIEVGSGGSITVPDATFAAGDVVSIFNNTTGTVTLTMSITTAYIGGADVDEATIDLATRGVATILFISGTVCVVNGNVS